MTLFSILQTKILVVIAVLLAAILTELEWQRARQTAFDKQITNFWGQVDRYKKTEPHQWGGK